MMRAPWRNKTGLARLIAISVAILQISLGLCGLNFVGFMTVGDRTGPLLGVTGVIELAGIVLSVICLGLLGLVTLVQSARKRSRDGVPR